MRANPSLLASVAALFAAIAVHAQGTAFTYQGRLHNGTNHATGIYDLTFSVWTTAVGPAQIGGSVTNLATGMTNGHFAVSLDFGSGVFDGSPRWLEIGVRTNGVAAFTTLAPRQSLNAVPYAIFAGGVDAAGICGTIPSSNIGSGTITANMLAPGAAATNLGASGQGAVPSGTMLVSADPNATNLVSAGYSRFGGQLDVCWQRRTSADGFSSRADHTAVWTGREMIVWGGIGDAGQLDSGGRYDPVANSWSAVTTSNAPAKRRNHTAVWTGDRMIIWGGADSITLATGAMYDPSNDSWLPVPTTEAPVARQHHTAIWTGSEMIVWGGNNGDLPYYLNTGGRYNPTARTWSPMSTNGAPSPRAWHSAIWAGKKMLVWGGLFVSGLHPNYVYYSYSDGAMYDPVMDRWSPITTNGAASARWSHSIVWTGVEMILWGGQFTSGHQPNEVWTTRNDGARYNPLTDTWQPVSMIGSPSGRECQSAIWTGTEMVVWGGAALSQNGGGNDGGRYDPAANKWSVTSANDAPSGRSKHTAVWTGTDMLIHGGQAVLDGNQLLFGDTYSYAPSRALYLYLRQ